MDNSIFKVGQVWGYRNSRFTITAVGEELLLGKYHNDETECVKCMYMFYKEFKLIDDAK